MDFQQLLAKMQQLDQPVGEECGMPPPSMSPMAAQPPMDQPPPAHPSLSINLNAQGMDHIEQIMKLVAKVNPDMNKPDLPPLPTMGAEPSIMSIKPSMPPLKMLPDLSDEPHDEPDGDEGPEIKGLDRDGDGDHDMRDHDMEKKKDKDEAFGNTPADGAEPELKGLDAAIPDGNDLNKPKKSYSDKPYRGDNPMATESTSLRAQIRADLMRRLNEAKGAK